MVIHQHNTYNSIQNKINASIINKKELGSSEVNTDPAISISSPPISVSLEKISIPNKAIIFSNIRTNELCSSNQNKNVKIVVLHGEFLFIGQESFIFVSKKASTFQQIISISSACDLVLTEDIIDHLLTKFNCQVDEKEKSIVALTICSKLYEIFLYHSRSMYGKDAILCYNRDHFKCGIPFMDSRHYQHHSQESLPPSKYDGIPHYCK